MSGIYIYINIYISREREKECDIAAERQRDGDLQIDRERLDSVDTLGKVMHPFPHEILKKRMADFAL